MDALTILHREELHKGIMRPSVQGLQLNKQEAVQVVIVLFCGFQSEPCSQPQKNPLHQLLSIYHHHIQSNPILRSFHTFSISMSQLSLYPFKPTSDSFYRVIIYSQSMDSTLQNRPASNQPEPKMSPILCLSFSYDLYRITLGESAYIAKLFPPAKITNYQREKQILQMLDHPAIARPFQVNHPLSSRLSLSLKGELLLFPELSGGDLLEYLRWNGGLSEEAARFFTGQVVEALAYAHSKGVLHPNLLAQNVLLTAERRIVLAGWSNSTESPQPTLEALLFALGELIINLCTARRPFVSRDLRSDPFAKFLSDKHIHKFWEQMEKVVKKLRKGFAFSEEAKQLISSLLLGKLDSIDAVLISKWMTAVPKQAEVQAELAARQFEVKKIKEQRRSKSHSQEQGQSGGLLPENTLIHRKGSRASQIFQEEYENYEFGDVLIEPKTASDLHPYFKLCSGDLRILVSHLRAKLKEAERQQAELVSPLLVLREPEVNLVASSLQISCTFGWNYDLLPQEDLLCGMSFTAQVILRKDGQVLHGRIRGQAGELSGECAGLMHRWLMETLQS